MEKKKHGADGGKALKALKRTLRLMAKAARLILIALAATLIGLAIAIGEIDPNRHKDEIAAEAAKLIGREIEIAGDLGWSFANFEPGIDISGLSIRNAKWGQARDFLKADRAVASVSLKDLLRKKISIETILISNPAINLEVAKNGRRNWNLGEDKAELQGLRTMRRAARRARAGEPKPQPKESAFSINISSVEIKDADIRYSNAQSGAFARAAVRRFELSHSDPDMPMEIEAELEYNGGIYTAQISNFFTEKNGTTDVLISGSFNLNGARAKLAGKINNLMELASMTGTLKLEAKDAEAAFGNLLPLPAGQRLSLAADFIATQRFVSIPDIALSFGTMEAKGSAEITLAGRRPSVKAELDIPLLDIPNLFYPEWEPAYRKRLATGEEKPDEPAEAIENPKAFRDIPLPVSELDLANLNLKAHVGELKAMPDMPVNDISITAMLNNGKAVVAPITMEYMGGKVAIDAIANNLNGTFNGEASVAINGVEIGRIVDSTGYLGIFNGGATNADIVLKGRGRNLEEFMKTLSGYIKVYSTSPMEGYSIDRALMTNDLISSVLRFLANDVVNAATGRKAKAPQSHIQCMVANLDVRDGKTISNRGIAVQTEAANFIVDGSADIGGERIDVSLITIVKEGFKVSNSLVEMIKIEGPMAEPRIIISRDGVINNLTKTAFMTAVAGVLTGGITLITAGIGILTKSWVENIREDANPCLTAFEGKGSMRPNENFGEQVVIKETLKGRLEDERQSLEDTTTERINRARDRAKTKLEQ